MDIKLVEELTKEQKAEFPRFRDKWIKIGLNTDPINKVEARKAVMECYDLSEEKLECPEFVIFVKSPFQLFYVKPIWNHISEYVESHKNDQGLYSDKYSGHESPDRNLWMFVDKPKEWNLRITALQDIFDAIYEEVQSIVVDRCFRGDKRAFDRAFAAVQQDILKNFDNYFNKFIASAKSEIDSAIYGQNETWLCFYDFMEWAGSTGLEGTYGLQHLAQNAGWWIPYDVIAVVSDRPKQVHIDDEGRLHSHAAPAIEFRDGWRYYASHGVQLPAWVIERPELLSVEKIDNEENAEVRRVMLELYGLEAYFENGNYELVDGDSDPHTGTLWKKSLEDDEDIYMLEMLNSTKEPDGHYKTYVIRVPPTMRTARQANAWSYGFNNPQDYQPELQS